MSPTRYESSSVSRPLAGALLLLLLAAAPLVVACGGVEEQSVAGGENAAGADAAVAADDSAVTGAAYDGPRGLITRTDGVGDGYVLFAPLLSDTTYLIDNDGLVVHTWTSEYAPSGSVYLLDNGNLLRGGRKPDAVVFTGGGQGGILEEFTWDGEKVWEFEFASEEHLLHHDIELLSDGNILAIAWEAKSPEEALQAGRHPGLVPESGLWPDMVVEIEPQRPRGGRIVWEWRAWDHLVQDFDQGLPNYGDPAAHPGRIDVNGASDRPEISAEELEQLKALGYVPPDAQPEDLGADMFHTNAVAYNAALDQIALSTPRFNEIWIIDHSTTTAEAAGSSGGRHGKGGDLLYRWGNPKEYGRGDDDDQKLFGQHDVRWIPEGFPGAGNLMIFNNSVPAGEGAYSSVIEITPPVDAAGAYALAGDAPWGPAEPAWEYRATGDQPAFFSPFISGATRLPDGNTLICSGAPGRIFEVDASGDIVWDFRDPHSGDVRMPDGSTPHPVGEFTYAVFRATRIPPDHAALSGRSLTPLEPQPPIAAQDGEGGGS